MKLKNNYPLVTVGALIFSEDCQILLIRSPKWSVDYTIPGGKVELGETREEALIREVFEETGLSIGHIQFAMVQESIFSKEYFKPNHFVMNDYIVQLIPPSTKETVKLNEEGIEYRWVDPKQALALNLNKETYNLIEWYLKQL